MKLKKITALAAAALMAATALTGCGGSKQAAEDTPTATAEAKKITGAADLAGAKIAVQEGTTGDTYVTDEVEGAEISRFKRIVDAGMDLRNGRVDAVVVDDQVAKDLVAEMTDLEILPDILTEEEYAIAVGKGDSELLDAVNAVLDEYTADDFNELMDYAISIQPEI